MAHYLYLMAASVYFCFSFLLNCPLSYFLVKPRPSAKAHSSPSFLNKLSTLDGRKGFPRIPLKGTCDHMDKHPHFTGKEKMRPRGVTHSEGAGNSQWTDGEVVAATPRGWLLAMLFLLHHVATPFLSFHSQWRGSLSAAYRSWHSEAPPEIFARNVRKPVLFHSCS